MPWLPSLWFLPTPMLFQPAPDWLTIRTWPKHGHGSQHNIAQIETRDCCVLSFFLLPSIPARLPWLPLFGWFFLGRLVNLFNNALCGLGDGSAMWMMVMKLCLDDLGQLLPLQVQPRHSRHRRRYWLCEKIKCWVIQSGNISGSHKAGHDSSWIYMCGCYLMLSCYAVCSYTRLVWSCGWVDHDPNIERIFLQLESPSSGSVIQHKMTQCNRNIE